MMADDRDEKSPWVGRTAIAVVDMKGKSVDEVADAVWAAFEAYKRANGLA
jgi:hypothetical protein